MKPVLPILAILASAAQSQTIWTPTLGHVFQPDTAAIRPINGIPGASFLAAPLLTGLRSASVSRSADTAIVAKSDGLFLVTGLRSPNPVHRVLSETADPYLAAWGKSSAIFYSAGGFQFLSSFDENPTALNVQIPTGEVTALDFDGETLLIALSHPANGGVHRFQLADSSLRQIFSIPSPLAIARHGDRLYAAQSGTKSIFVYDLNGVLTAEIPTPVQPTQLTPTGDSNLFLISSEPRQPLWVFNGASTFFIPAEAAQ